MDTESLKTFLDLITEDGDAGAIVFFVNALGLTSKETFRKNYMGTAIEMSLVKMTLPDKPNSKNQRYNKL